MDVFEFSPAFAELAFDELYAEFSAAVLRYFMKDFPKSTAEHLRQQTFLQVWKYLGSPLAKSPRKRKAWLFAIAKNVKNDHLRYIQRHSMDFRYGELTEVTQSDGSDLEKQVELQMALRSLSEDDAKLLSMSQYLSSREIGSVLGISASAVRSRLQKAKERLSEAVKN